MVKKFSDHLLPNNISDEVLDSIICENVKKYVSQNLNKLKQKHVWATNSVLSALAFNMNPRYNTTHYMNTFGVT